MPLYNNQSISNIPLPPRTGKSSMSFPNDLVVGSRNFYTSFHFMDYNSTTNFGSALSGAASIINDVYNAVTGRNTQLLSTSYTPSGSVRLPIPKKLNDIQTVVWDQISATSLAGSAISSGINGLGGQNASNIAGAIAAGGTALGPGVGLTINPLLFMTFKSPTFKEHTLNWVFTPNNEAESNSIRDIVNFFKFNMLPESSVGFYKYPSICFIQIYPSSAFTFKFKPCAVTSVQVDYTGGGGPSFYKNGAPTVVNFTVQLKEIELWTKNNYTS